MPWEPHKKRPPVRNTLELHKRVPLVLIMPWEQHKKTPLVLNMPWEPRKRRPLVRNTPWEPHKKEPLAPSKQASHKKIPLVLSMRRSQALSTLAKHRRPTPLP
jgi:hypothetical protein